MSDITKCSNVCIIKIPEKEREEGAENLLEEVTAENFPNLGKERYPDPRGTESPNKINPKRSTPRHTGIKMAKCGVREFLKKQEKRQHLHTREAPSDSLPIF